MVSTPFTSLSTPAFTWSILYHIFCGTYIRRPGELITRTNLIFTQFQTEPFQALHQHTVQPCCLLHCLLAIFCFSGFMLFDGVHADNRRHLILSNLVIQCCTFHANQGLNAILMFIFILFFYSCILYHMSFVQTFITKSIEIEVISICIVSM